MALGENLKQQLGPLFGEGSVTQLIDDQQTVGGIALHHPAQAPFVSNFDQLISQSTAGEDSVGQVPKDLGE